MDFENEGYKHPLLKVVMLTLICSDKYKYEPDFWNELKDAINDAITKAAGGANDIILGLNIFNENAHLKCL